MESLRLDDDGRVVGVVANGPDHRVVVEADSVIIATGGFQGNEQLVQQFTTTHPDNLVLRSNPWSTGDGLLAALEVGAKTTVGMDTFYGHNLIAPPAQYSPLEFVEATQYYGPFGIAVDADGERFTDESEAPFEFTLAQDTAVIADGRAFLIIDSDIYDSHTPTEMHIGSIVERARDYGGPVAEVDDLDGIREVLTEWGSNGSRAVRTIEGYNEALREGKVDELTPPRRDNHLVIDTPPYYVVEVRPGITFTMGGLDVNENGEVLRRTGTSSMLDQPVEDVRDVLTDSIEGLYAAGADVGNIHHRHYLGGLTVALITGLEVGENAAKHSQHHAD
jgi:succinate dehydrogenase/fumarate reductase flavoprotein subunit